MVRRNGGATTSPSSRSGGSSEHAVVGADVMSTALEPVARPRSVWRPVALLVGLMWVAELIDLVLPYDADALGIRSRSLAGLPGIVLAPLLHLGFAHLVANTVPLVVLGLLVSWRAGRLFWPVVGTIVLLGGAGVWALGAPGVVTLGASGLVFGLLTYLLTAGVLTRHWLDVLIAVGVLLTYGSLLWGALPMAVPDGVSWLGHLCGAAAGTIAAFAFAQRSGRG